MPRAASIALSALLLIGTSSAASGDEIRIAGGSSLDVTPARGVGALPNTVHQKTRQRLRSGPGQLDPHCQAD